MPDLNERLDGVEQTLTTLTEHVKEQFTKVEEQFTKVDEQFTKLRMLGEENTAQIKVIADVQAHHGGVLDGHGAALKRIEEALEPFKVLPAAIQTCFRDLSDHERRITALEAVGRHTTPET